ncbi:MAG TPA: hypothetical protein VFN67_34770 [Polyangiales bacterium]|nr:hypothetical protein [Polyangiales bacterium]
MARYGVRLFVSTLAVLLLPPFLAVAAVPLALLLFPVAWLAIPFIVTTLLGDALTAGAQPKKKPKASVPDARWLPLTAPRRS